MIDVCVRNCRAHSTSAASRPNDATHMSEAQHVEPNALDASSTSCGSNTSSWNAPVRPWKSHESGVEAGLRSSLSQRAPGHGAVGSGCALSSAPTLSV